MSRTPITTFAPAQPDFSENLNAEFAAVAAYADSAVLRATNTSELADALATAADTPGLLIELAADTEYVLTSPLAIPQSTSMRGAGRSTVLRFTGCDGLVFDDSDYIGPQFFSNFYISGNGYVYTAVKALGDADVGRVEAVVFDNVLIDSFKTAFHLRSTHGFTMRKVTADNIWEGVKIAGQTITPLIEGNCKFSRGVATGTGESKGLQVLSASDYNPGAATEKGPEGIRVARTTFFGFDVAVDHVLALDTDYESLTLGMVGHTAMRITSTQGSFRFGGKSWIGYDDGALYGIHAVALGSANTSTIILDGIHADVESGKTTHADSIGCAIDSFQNNVKLGNTNWNGSRLHDIRLNFAGKVELDNYACNSATAGASLQLVSFGGGTGPYYIGEGTVATNITEHASNTGQIIYRSPKTATVASATSLTLPGGDCFTITGTTSVTSIAATSTWAGRTIRLMFSGILTFTDGNNLKLAGNFVTSADDSITLTCFDGTNWHEVARSAN